MSNVATTSFGDKGPASSIVKGGLKLECTNGKGWELGDNKVPLRAQIISSKDSGLPQDVHWRQNWKTGGYKGCSASYNTGKFEEGVVRGSKIQAGVAHASLGSQCRVESTV